MRTCIKLGLVAIGALIASCSSQSISDAQRASRGAEKQGSIELGLVPVSGVTLNSVHYTVTSSSTPPALVAEGDLPTPGSSTDFSFGLSLPVGNGYSISLSAASAETGDNITCGGSFGPFDVAPNSASGFKIVLTCHDDTSGGIIGSVDTKTDACPRLVFDYVVATPSFIEVGMTSHLSGKAHDLDGKPVTYTWNAASPGYATFTPTTGATTTLLCTASRHDLPITLTASNGECTKVLSTHVSCGHIDGCSNGILDPGEQCDKAIPGTLCPADCSYSCGDGVAEAPVEDCDPGNTANCTATCKTRAPLCNDGFLTNGEICDPSATPSVPAGTPAHKVCNPFCTGFNEVPIPLCGNGIVDAWEECDDASPPFLSSPASPTCSSICKKISTDACVTCENAGDCFESVDNCLGVAAPFSLADQNKCFDVMDCIQESNCLDGTGTLGKCYCGDLAISACGAAPFSGPGSPNGACVAQIKAGFPTFTSNSAILGGLLATDFPAGAAMKRLSCQKGANSSACLASCGFTAGGPAFP